MDRELTERANRRLATRLRFARLRQEACLEDIDFRHPRGLDRSVVLGLADCRWIAHHDNCVIVGPTGAGIEAVSAAWRQGRFNPLIVYPRGVWFVVSDDYMPLFAALNGRPDYIPCWVLGEPKGDLVKDVQGPIEQGEVAKALGIG